MATNIVLETICPLSEGGRMREQLITYLLEKEDLANELVRSLSDYNNEHDSLTIQIYAVMKLLAYLQELASRKNINTYKLFFKLMPIFRQDASKDYANIGVYHLKRTRYGRTNNKSVWNRSEEVLPIVRT